jgi:hypothetical protein
MTGTWQGLANQPPFNTSTMILLTDGRVMVQEEATAPVTTAPIRDCGLAL